MVQLRANEFPSPLLDVDLALKLSAIEFHVLVRVPGVAVTAAKLAAAIRVHGPSEWHPVGVAAVQDRAHRPEKTICGAPNPRPKCGSGATRARMISPSTARQPGDARL